jgi:uncharacterized damage-inducible protein DinB
MSKVISTALDTLMSHNTWATGVLIDDAQKLSDEQLHRRFAIGPGSVHDTLRHIVGAMLRWADRIGGRDVRESIEKTHANLPPAELRRFLGDADADLRKVAEETTAQNRWSESMTFTVPDGPTYHFSRLSAMLHVLTHGMHHRAQVLNLRRQLGLPSLELDLDVVEWECIQTGQLTSPT